MSPAALYALALAGRGWAAVDHPGPSMRVDLVRAGCRIELRWEAGACRYRQYGPCGSLGRRIARWLSEPGTPESWRIWMAREIMPQNVA